MYRILIVDDEQWIRDGLKSKLKRSGFPISEILEAENGEAALAELEKSHPDIILSDICMEGMDGLQLFENLAARYPDVQKIVISGYSEFDYAAKAIQTGVVQYLLKPIDIGELIGALKICEKRLQEKGRHQTGKNLLDGVSEASENYEQLWDSDAGRKSSFSEYQSQADFSCGYFYFYGPPALSPGEILSILLKGAEKEFAFERNLYPLKLAPFEYAVVLMETCGTHANFSQKCVLFCKTVLEELEKNGSGQVSCGLGTARDPRAAIQNARFAMYHRIFYPDSDILLPSMVEEHRGEYVLRQSYRTACEFYIRSGQYPPFCDLLQIISQEAAAVRISYRQMELLYQTLRNSVLRSVPQEKAENAPDRPLWQYHTTEGVFRSIKELFRSAVSLGGDSSKADLAYTIKNEADTNFGQPLSLEKLAEEHYVSPSYLSTLFKEVVGVNFQEYLLQVRLKAAKELMDLKHYKIKDIAELTGFCDQHYFSRVFKKECGVTPREYLDRPDIPAKKSSEENTPFPK